MTQDNANHDAVPAAIASVESVVPQPTTHGDSDRTDKAAPRPSEGTGNTQETQTTPAEPSTPGDGTSHSECPYVTGTVTRHCTLTPLTLTDAERFVLREVRDAYADRDEVASSEIAAVIDGLLERTQ